MSNHDDAVFVRNFSMVLVGLAVVGILAFILAKVVNRSHHETLAPDEMVAARIAPMGQVNTGAEPIAMANPAAGEANSAPAAGSESVATSADPGQATYDKVCFTCHAQGIAGAPKYGDMAAWENRLGRGRDANVANAINGYSGNSGVMPAKGGNPTLSDEEVAAAVDYMLAAVGGKAAPEAPAPAPEPQAESATPPAAAAEAEEAAAVAAAPAADGRGKEVYDAACFVCHASGAAGAPKIGDVQAWADRIAKGLAVLEHNAINGVMGNGTMMPPKGGRPDFSDDDVKAAVAYITENSQ